jgi:hypothetical protein
MIFMMLILHAEVEKEKNEVYIFFSMYKSWNELDFDPTKYANSASEFRS